MATNITEVVSAAARSVISAPTDFDGTAAGLLFVQFSKDVEQITAETEANYVITGGPSGSYTGATGRNGRSVRSAKHQQKRGRTACNLVRPSLVRMVKRGRTIPEVGH